MEKIGIYNIFNISRITLGEKNKTLDILKIVYVS